jgi:hypothetical protein
MVQIKTGKRNAPKGCFKIRTNAKGMSGSNLIRRKQLQNPQKMLKK